jgi:hypothetical protein
MNFSSQPIQDACQGQEIGCLNRCLASTGVKSLAFRGKIRLLVFTLILALVVFARPLSAELAVKIEPPKQVGKKVVVKLTMKNNFNEKIESARAQIFLLDEKGRVMGQAAKWIIGGTKDKKSLAPNAETTFNFVLTTDKPFATNSVTFSRVVLESGKLVDIKKDVQLTTTAK